MSLITKCPACDTMFKVVPDQLRVSDGWVRCGQCNEVFDANLNLQDETFHLGSGAVQDEAHQVDAFQTQAAPAATNHVLPEPHSSELPEARDDQVSEPFLAVNPQALHFESDVPADQSVEPDFRATDDLVQTREEVAEHSFLQPEVTASAGARRALSVLFSILCVVLGMVLVLQIVLQERDRVAAMAPATKSTLEALCSVVGCTVAPLRQIESVLIESSSFTKVRSDVYRLSFAIKNTGHTSVATPSVELTLTDRQDLPVIRRVFHATEFGDGSGALEAGAELSVTMPISVKVAGNSEKIAGYRLLSFYP
jgi:predicted Zn finger-like uncharacterized protein